MVFGMQNCCSTWPVNTVVTAPAPLVMVRMEGVDVLMMVDMLSALGKVGLAGDQEQAL